MTLFVTLLAGLVAGAGLGYALHWLWGLYTKKRAASEAGLQSEISFFGNGEAFVTSPGPFTDLIAGAVREVTGRAPALSTTGGTSDARFIKDLAPVVEFGLVGASMHKIDEHAALADITKLTEIYERILALYFQSSLI